MKLILLAVTVGVVLADIEYTKGKGGGGSGGGGGGGGSGGGAGFVVSHGGAAKVVAADYPKDLVFGSGHGKGHGHAAGHGHVKAVVAGHGHAGGHGHVAKVAVVSSGSGKSGVDLYPKGGSGGAGGVVFSSGGGGGGHGKVLVDNYPKGGKLGGSGGVVFSSGGGGGGGSHGKVLVDNYPKGGKLGGGGGVVFSSGGGGGGKGVIVDNYPKGGKLGGGGVVFGGSGGAALGGAKGGLVIDNYPKGGRGGASVVLGGGKAAVAPAYPKGGLGGLGGVVIGGGGLGAAYPKGAGGADGNGATRVGGHGYFPGAGKVQGNMRAVYGRGKGYGPSYGPIGFVPFYRRVASVAPLGGACPFGWQVYNNMCYYFSRDKLSWYEAAMKCEYMGGYLAVANSAHENSYLKLMASKNNMGPGVWIGLNDCLFPKTHTWYWGFGKKQCKWFDWFGKEPLFDGNNKNCVSLWEHYHYCWKLDNCRSKLYYVCEMARGKPCKCNAY